MSYTYKTTGTCSKKIHFDLDGDVVKNIRFEGGCEGNLKALAILADGLTIDEIQTKCRGICCGKKGTSCADQLAIAVKNCCEVCCDACCDDCCGDKKC